MGKSYLNVPDRHVGKIIIPELGTLAVIKRGKDNFLVYVEDGGYVVNGGISNSWIIRHVKTNYSLGKPTILQYEDFYFYTGPRKVIKEIKVI